MSEDHPGTIKCARCGADPCGRWRQPPKIIFCDPYAQGAGASGRDFVYSCRDCLSQRREAEIRKREAPLGIPGGLR
jgi:hypothetical protein